jgi:alkylation response protein AidB-like acyl-CoA dehydrogenase
MDSLHEQTLEYLNTREQFGVKLGKFQALQHRSVDMFVACQEARTMTYVATLSLDKPRTERIRAVSAAKSHIGRAGRLVGQEAVQLHGGMGMTDELAVGHYFKRLTMIDTLFGNMDHHLERFAAAVYS